MGNSKQNYCSMLPSADNAILGLKGVLSRWYRARLWNMGKGIGTVRDENACNSWAVTNCRIASS